MARNTYEERLKKTQNPLTKRLLEIIIEKKSNLCVAANFDTVEELIKFCDIAGKYICVLKTQLRRIPLPPDEEILPILYKKKKEHNFLLFEDVKLIDSEDTIFKIYRSKYVKYVDLVTVIGPVNGAGVYRAIERGIKEERQALPEDEFRGCLAVCEFSFEDLDNPAQRLELAEKHAQTCVGIIAQKLRPSPGSDMLKFCPGVHMERTNDGWSNQQWRHPNQVIGDGADIVIVGRGITAESELEEVTRRYKEACWQAYCDQTV